MMKKISTMLARKNLSELINKVFYSKESVVITRRNKDMAVIMSLFEYEKLKNQGN